MANSKMTKREHYAVLKGIVENSNYADKDGALAFIAHEVELLDKKHSKKTDSKKEIAKENLKDLICDVLATFDRPVTIAELLATEELSVYDGRPMTNQRLSSMLTQLGSGNEKVVGEGRVRKTYEKKVPYYELV